MTPEMAGRLHVISEWIPATELRKFRRLYFTSDKLLIINAVNEISKIYLFMAVIILMVVGGVISQPIFRGLGFLYGFFITVVCGGFFGALISVVLYYYAINRTNNKLKRISIEDALKLDKYNYFINYSDISNVTFEPKPKSTFLSEAALHIVSASGTHKYMIPQKYVSDVSKLLDQIKIPQPNPDKHLKKLKLKGSTDPG